MSKLEMINKKQEELRTQQGLVSKEQAKQLEKLNKASEKLRLERLDLIKKFETKVFNKFKGISINLTNNEQGIKITIGETFILEHLYNDSSFENIDKSLYKEIVSMYEEVYGEPNETTPYAPYSFSQAMVNYADITQTITNFPTGNGIGSV